ncbi:hypothetical protein LCGC14_2480840 [marine sediment metagenome]|uniref:Uncharacterized protein n=1 Tax=marine sediment metagenome TaxID=412755 RepID=A0A0F9BVD2_9ZZZZ
MTSGRHLGDEKTSLPPLCPCVQEEPMSATGILVSSLARWARSLRPRDTATRLCLLAGVVCLTGCSTARVIDVEGQISTTTDALDGDAVKTALVTFLAKHAAELQRELLLPVGRSTTKATLESVEDDLGRPHYRRWRLGAWEIVGSPSLCWASFERSYGNLEAATLEVELVRRGRRYIVRRWDIWGSVLSPVAQ